MIIDNLEVLGETLVLGMDVKHVIKRLRNNVFNSGITSLCTRHLHWKGFPIIWDHWRSAFHWDITCNPEMTRLHHKLTKEHIELTSSSKMRNHLAEDCLNDKMWFLMKSYSDSLDEGQRHEITGSINFLSITSQLISFVNNDCTVIHLADERFSVLENTISWFSKWETEVLARTDVDSMLIKKSYLMSNETREDILFCCTSLREIMKKRIKSGSSVMPSRLNSDIVEIFFGQQRSQNHGSNTNPTYLQYSKGVNSVVLGRSIVKHSKKSNAGLKGSTPYNFTSSEPLSKRGKRR